MKSKSKYVIICTVALLATLLFATASIAAAAPSITLNPTTQNSGAQVTVTGTGFGATLPVGIGIGQEIAVVNEVHSIPTPTGTGPFTAKTNHYPIKPGSFSYHCVVSSDSSVVESDYTDNGDGTLTASSTYALNPFENYVTGSFGRSTTSAWDGYTVTFTCNYTYYAYSVTPAAGVTTSAAGGFTADITIPPMPAGAYTVTAIDTHGAKSTSTITTVPEGLTFGIVAVLSSVAVIATILWKRPKTPKLFYKKL
jgi:hypothetical protein